MQAAALKKFVNGFALFVAIVIAIVVPVGNFIDNRSDAIAMLEFKGRLNAARIAQYIYTHETLWQYQQLRLAELIQLPDTGDPPINQRIYDESGSLVYTQGVTLAPPVMARRTPIVVSGWTVGWLVVETSLSEILRQAGLVALVSMVLGFGVYASARLLPLRLLDRVLAALHDTQRNLEIQNERLDAAVNNMAQGLVMFDSSARLVVCNKRYLDMFGLSQDMVAQGSTIEEVLAQRVATGGFSADMVEEYRAELLASVAKGTTFTKITPLPDGRIISIVNVPMAGGGWVATHDDITERLRTDEKIKHLAQFDALTDLPNRATFYERMDSALGGLRHAESIAVFSLDLDRFKNVNDMLGHPIGDLLLQTAAKRMRSCVREEDLIARLGGDEFAVVQVPSRESSDVAALATRLIEVVGAPYELEGHQVIVGVSVGIAVAPGDGTKPDTLMKNADMALYRAKADGGGVYRFFELAMDARMQARRALELDLRKAIVKGEFALHYQPIIDVKTRQITSCEALIRWRHPERGMIGPAEFIPIAEATGLIVPLGEWVIRQACNDAARWPHHVTVSVNLSPAQFKSRNLMATVVGALAASGLPAKRLELEITEMVLLQDNEGAFVVLHRLRDLGIRIAMDDFGTGYSSLGYLRSFPFDKIKIDQSFIHDLPAKEDSIAIIRAVVGLSSSMGITTTAEGVATPEQLARLESEGCDEVQGFLFSPPRPVAELRRLFDELAPGIEAVA
jgi:diguanylate cyclase (GGDEF)-like protein